MRPTIRVDRLLGSLAQRNPQSLVFLAFSALCVFFLTYRFLFSSNVYRTEKQAAANPIYDRSAPFNINHKTPTSEDALPDPLEANNIPNVDSTFWSKIDTLLVIPGGGSGLPLHNASSAKSTAFETAGYPEWTRRRTSTAFEFYQTHRKSNGNKDNEESSAMEDSMVFLALSAGSLNAPNVLFDDRRVMFECQHTMQHLLALGVHPKRVFGDYTSWDTVTNAHVLRTFVESILLFRAQQPSPTRPLEIHVFISDFHLHRMQTAIQWIFGLTPQPLRAPAVTLHYHSVDSLGIPALQPASAATDVSRSSAWQARMQHEQTGVQMLLQQQRRITSLSGLRAFLQLGGHNGLRNYLLQRHHPSGTAAGW